MAVACTVTNWGKTMTKTLTALALCLSLTATIAQAGGTAEPQMTPPVIIEDTQDNSGHILVPILALIFMGAAL